MCAISGYPAAGDTSVDIMSDSRRASMIFDTEHYKKTYDQKRDKNENIRRSLLISDSINTVKDNMHDEFKLIQNDPLNRTSDIEYGLDYCGFPYYRSELYPHF